MRLFESKKNKPAGKKIKEAQRASLPYEVKILEKGNVVDSVKTDRKTAIAIQDTLTKFSATARKTLTEGINASKVKTAKDWVKAIDTEIGILNREKTIAVALDSDLDGLLKAICAKAGFENVPKKSDVAEVEMTSDRDNPDLVMPAITLKSTFETEEIEFEGEVTYKGVKFFCGWFEEDITFMF